MNGGYVSDDNARTRGKGMLKYCCLLENMHASAVFPVAVMALFFCFRRSIFSVYG